MTPASHLAFDLLAKSASVLLLAFAVQHLRPRMAASRNCLVWLAAFTVVAMLPLTWMAQPLWAWHWPDKPATMVVQAAPFTISNAAVMTNNVPAQPSARQWRPELSVAEALGPFWLAGTILVLAHRASGSLQLRRLEKHTRPATDERAVALAAQLAAELGVSRLIDLRESGSVAVPLTWGGRKPVLVLPVASLQWSRMELESALRHELGHIRHWDAVTRWLMCVVCALQWPNVFVWLAARAWRTAQEQACDDLVVAASSRVEAYARQLLEAARTIQVSGLIRVPAMAMAQPSTLEQRLCAVLDETRDRSPIQRRPVIAGGAAALTALLLCSALQLRAVDQARPESAAAQVQVEAKILEMPAGAARAVLAGLAPAPSVSVTMSSAQAADFLAKLQSQKGVDMLSTPSVVTISGKEATISCGREVAVPDAKPDIVFAGINLNLLPVVQSDDEIEIKADLTVTGPGGVNTQRNVAQPIMQKQKITSTVRLPQGSTVALAGGAGGHEQRQTLILISAKVLTKGEMAARKEAPKPVSKTYERAAKIILPRVAFDGAAVDEALEYLRAKSKELDPDKQGVNIVLVDPASARDARITLSLTNVPLTEVLRYVARFAERTLRFEDNAAVVLEVAPAVSSIVSAAAGFSVKPAAESPLLKHASAILLPSVEFQEATVQEAVEFLRVKSNTLDDVKQGVNIVLRLPKDHPSTKITLSLRNVPLSEALRYVAGLAGLALHAEAHAFVLEPK